MTAAVASKQSCCGHRCTNNNELLLLAVSIGVFVGTALLSQWLLQRPRPNGSDDDDDDELRASLEASTGTKERRGDSEESYLNRRHRERLSPPLFMETDLDGGSTQTTSDNEDCEFRGTPNESFLPKNSNWNHFEQYHHHHQRQQQKGSSQIGVVQPCPGKEKMAFEECSAFSLSASPYDDDGDDDDDTAEKGGTAAAGIDSDDVSLESNDHFVWTSARYSPTQKQTFRKHHPTATLPVVLSRDKIFVTDLLVSPDQASALRRRNGGTESTKPVVGHHHRSKSTSPSPTKPAPSPVTRMPPFNKRMNQTSDGGSSLPLEPSVSQNVKHQNRAARAHYNSRIMPQKVVLIRHGQSMGNIDEHMYSTTPDNAMPLTKLGWEQTCAAGRHLKDRVLDHPDNRVHFIVSPYVRAVETFHGVISAWCDPAEFRHIADRDQRLSAWYGRLLEMGLTWQEDPRIREQDFGNYQQPELIKKSKQEQKKFGAFYYRFPHGESASDVFDRVSTFLDSLWRSFDMNKSRHYVLITHGISIRVILTRYFRYTVDQFHLLANPQNCEMVVLEHDNRGRLELAGRHELELVTDEATGEKHPRQYTKHKRLRVLPQEYVRHVRTRMSYND
jgi:broad specificity phosphatase PhoE